MHPIMYMTRIKQFNSLAKAKDKQEKIIKIKIKIKKQGNK